MKRNLQSTMNSKFGQFKHHRCALPCRRDSLRNTSANPQKNETTIFKVGWTNLKRPASVDFPWPIYILTRVYIACLLLYLNWQHDLWFISSGNLYFFVFWRCKTTVKLICRIWSLQWRLLFHPSVPTYFYRNTVSLQIYAAHLWPADPFFVQRKGYRAYQAENSPLLHIPVL